MIDEDINTPNKVTSPNKDDEIEAKQGNKLVIKR